MCQEKSAHCKRADLYKRTERSRGIHIETVRAWPPHCLRGQSVFIRRFAGFFDAVT